MAFDPDYWRARLIQLGAVHHVPAASLAVLANGQVHELAVGVLHRGTGVAATTDTIFQSGSIAKVYTATVIMRLVDSGHLDIDTRVADVLPGFAVADPETTRTATVRQLLSHTSGISGDFTLDTGRGDDCLARYVDACAKVGQDCPPGTVISYSSTGYNLLGRIIEELTGQTWDEALKEFLFTPLGLSHSMTLPEEALRFRAAMGHLGPLGQDPDPALAWDLMPRSAGPYGRVLVTAGDIVRFARMHLDGGTTPDGTRLLQAETVAAMQSHEVATEDRWTFGSHAWGLGWALYDWGGVRGYGHDGASIGQYGYLRVAPDSGVAVALLTNGGGAPQLASSLLPELLDDLAGARVPDSFAPSPGGCDTDIAPFVGTYQREGVTITVADNGKPHIRYELTGGMREFSAPIEMELVPVSDTVFAAPGGDAINSEWVPVVFSTLPDGTGLVYVGMRAAPRVA